MNWYTTEMGKKKSAPQQPPEKNTARRGLILSDFHCGSKVGLTPPKWVDQTHNPKLMSRLWDWYCEAIEERKPYSFVVINGDALDGNQAKNMGIGCITPDRNEQAEMGKQVVAVTACDEIHFVAGTEYHVGAQEDWELVLAKLVNGNIENAEEKNWNFHDRLFGDIDGIQLNCKHKIGSSNIPHGRLTAIAREILQNRQWHLEGSEPRANILIRSHVHYKELVYHDDCWGVVTPGLQALGSRYGARQCAGVVHFGVTFIDVDKDRYAETGGAYVWQKALEGIVQKAKVISL